MARLEQDEKAWITGIIVARNESDKVAHALASVRPIVNELLFYDMESTDETAEIAATFGAIVTSVPFTGYPEPVRQMAVSNATGMWVLMFDADELIQPRLGQTLLRIAYNDEADAVGLPRFNYLFGKPMQGALMGANDDRQVRFFKKGALGFSPEIHQPPCIQPGIRMKLLKYPEDGAIIHFNYIDIDNYLSKLNRYTSIESRQATAADTHTLRRTVLKMGWEFINRYFLKKGYRDGWRGLYIALSMSYYYFTIWARVCEHIEVGTHEDILAIYEREAIRVLKEPL